MTKKLFHAVLLSAALLVPASAAQEGIPMRGQDYFRDAVDLAGVLGSAHAIRVRCNGRDDQYWREYMRGLLDYEAPQRGPLRTSLVDQFNASYQSTTANYLRCDDRAIRAEAQFSETGQAITNRLAAHYFPKDSRTRTGP